MSTSEPIDTHEPIDTRQFLSTFKSVMDRAVAQVPEEEPAFVTLLRSHFAVDPTTLPILNERFEVADHPNIHIALTHLLQREGWSAKTVGMLKSNNFWGIKLTDLLGTSHGEKVKEGPVEYVNVPLADEQVLNCIQSGLYLIQHGEQKLALLVQGPIQRNFNDEINIELMAIEETTAKTFLSDMRTAMRAHNVYRSHVISLKTERNQSVTVNFHRLPPIERKNIILPSGILERVERQTLGFARLRDKLQAAGRHIKRGMLLHGPPGTGKTLTAMYLAHQMPDRTVILITGRYQGLIERSCKLARMLQPATVILEDVDLIGEERTRQDCGPLLFDLLNQMDGLADDADILFLLTTNRPDILEPALAARPGRVDQAVEIPLPDRDCRERLFALYSQGLTLNLHAFDLLLDQTEGVSGAFIRELMRKASLFSADENQDRAEIVIEDRHINAALKELVLDGGELTKQLLGASKMH
jgi:ATPase family associated with various cellular activities (AAA)